MRFHCSIACLLALALMASVSADPPASSTTRKPVEGIPSRIDAGSHILQPGDQIEIHVYSMPELEKVYEIRADGSFFHPLVGEVRGRGMTLAQLEAALKPRFSKELKRSSFRVGLHSLAEAEASVLGEVHNQGMYKFAPGSSVLDLVAHAGGLTNKADLDGAVILREGKPIDLDLSKKNQTSISNFLVQSGDVIYIHPGKKVGVSGEVHEKGLYAVSSRNGTIDDAIKAAGGASSAAALNRVQINRPELSEPLVVDLRPRADGSRPEPVLLKDGDSVVVPARRAVVLGAVDKPGAVNLTGQENLCDVVAAVGTSRGRLDEIMLVRAEDAASPSNTTKKEVYNLESYFKNGEGAPNVLIGDGDVVFVPTKEQGPDLLGGGGIVNLLLMARSFFSI